jgi:ankyrin repeat protein
MLSKYEMKRFGAAELHRALVFAAEKNYDDVWLSDTIAEYSLHKNQILQEAARDGHLHIVQYLLELPPEQRADVHADDDCALCLAVENDQQEVVRYLLKLPPEQRANIHAQNNFVMRFMMERQLLNNANDLLFHLQAEQKKPAIKRINIKSKRYNEMR